MSTARRPLYHSALLGSTLPGLENGPPESGAPRVTPGELVAGRYAVRRCLGWGGHGQVWEAEDKLAGTLVAVKLLSGDAVADPARIRREIAVLRLLRLPGVVRLLDEGTDNVGPFLVMERIEGTPFPGSANPPPCAWGAIASATAAVLETLGRIHAAGVVHRDLKPANILLDAEGRPTILDFGLSFEPTYGDAPSEEGRILGTPAYLAPEQIRLEPITAQTDLYALGLMLYEALSGVLPHDASDFQDLIFARLTERPPPLLEAAPAVPPAVAEIIDGMLSTEPEGRPRSVAEVLAALRGGSAEMDRIAGPGLPRLGSREPLRKLLEAAREGRSIDLVGPPGSGRSSCLRDLASALAMEGREVRWAASASDPFASLDPLMGPMSDQALGGLDSVTASVNARVRAVLAQGVIFIADDAERLDRWSAASLERGRSAGAIVRAFSSAEDEVDRSGISSSFGSVNSSRGADRPFGALAAGARGGADVVRLAPLDEAALLPLFTGLDRLFHLRTDAARALHARTDGLPARIADEVHAWVRAGLARWDGPALAIRRDAIDRLEAGLQVTPLPLLIPDKGRGGAARSPDLDDLLAWIALAGPSARAPLLASLVDQPLWLLEAKLEELVLAGAARRLADGRIELRVAPAAPFPPARQRAAHRAIAQALPAGSDRRLFHLVAGYEPTQEGYAAEIAREACELARRQAREGHLGHALATLREGLLALRQRPDPSDHSVGAEEVALLSLWSEIALFEGTPHAIDRLLHELCRAVPQSSAIAHLEALARAGLAFATGSERALAMTDAVPPFGDVRLERARQGIRVLAARRASQERLAAVLDEVAAWAKERADPEADAALAGWMGRLRYQQGRFDEAAELHAKAAAQEPWIIARIAALYHGASSLLEAFRHAEAAAVAREARGLAERCRHAHFEAECEWMLRAIAYRTAAPIAPDPELIAAVMHVGTPDIEANIYLTEACILWRAGRLAEAADIAERAHKIWSGMRKQWPALLAHCLSLRCRPPALRSEALSLAERAIQCPVHGMGIQALGLLAPIEPAVRLIAEPEAGRLSAEVPLRFWSMRIDVLSVLEALSALDIQGLPGR